MNATQGEIGETRAEFRDEAARWEAVVRRDPEADGAFVYSVRTTGVYCRPSCGSRAARRENVRFHEDSRDAERSGFRPCKRCRPDEGGLAQRQAVAIAAACRAIDGAEVAPTLDELAADAGMSRFHFHRVFRAHTGLTPRRYAEARRARRVLEALGLARTVTGAVQEAGFSSHGRFYDVASEALGMSPGAYRAGGEGLTLRYAVGECGLGSVLVAASDRGVCAILLGDDAGSLVKDLGDRFPKAHLVGDDPEFGRTLAAVIALVEVPGVGLGLPLDVRGTAFQRRVWEALRAIPAGATASYAEVARGIGSPGSARAVAGACAANPLAVAIPCHRVVRGDGSLSGYRWGSQRKAELLKRERESS